VAQTPVIIPPVQGPSVSRPTKFVVRGEEEGALRAVLTRRAGEIARLAADLKDMKVVGIVPNKTGRLAEVRCKIGHRTYKIGFHPYEGPWQGPHGPRTPSKLLEDVTTVLMSRKSGKDKSLAESMHLEALNWLKTCRPESRDYVRTSTACTAVFRELCRLGNPEQMPGLQALADAINSFVVNGGLVSASDEYQVKQAMKNFKTMAVHALKHGATLDMLQDAVNEAVVEETMTS
jgi:hypothetical protein